MAPKKEQSFEEQAAKILEKYSNDPQKLAQAYSELEAKFGEQGNELGTLRKQTDELTKAQQQYAQYIQQQQAQVEQWKPVMDWYQRPETQQQLALFNQYLQQQQAGATQPHYGQGQVDNSINQLLRPEEQQALYAQFAQAYNQQFFQPHIQQLNKQWEERVNKERQAILDEANKANKAFADTFWRLQETQMEPEKLAKLKKFQETAMRYADPKTYDPMKFAEDQLKTDMENARLQEQLEELQTKLKEREEKDVATLSGTPNGTRFFKELDELDNVQPTSKTERFDAVRKSTMDEVGREEYSKMFEDFATL